VSRFHLCQRAEKVAVPIFEIELLKTSPGSPQTAKQSEEASYWYYCKDLKTYYPSVSGDVGGGRPGVLCAGV
jgi:hypothetical protein